MAHHNSSEMLLVTYDFKSMRLSVEYDNWEKKQSARTLHRKSLLNYFIRNHLEINLPLFAMWNGDGGKYATSVSVQTLLED